MHGTKVADKASQISSTGKNDTVAGLLNCKNIVQVVRPDDIFRQIKIDAQIYHLVSAGIFLKWLE